MNKKVLHRISKFIPQCFATVITILIIISVFVSLKVNPTDYVSQQPEIRTFNQLYTIVGGNNVEDSFPILPKVSEGTVTTIQTILPEDLEDNYVILLRPDQLDTKVYIDDELRVDYSTKAIRTYGKVSPRRYIFMPVSKDDAGKIMKVELLTAVSNAGSFDVMSYGIKSDIIADLAGDCMGDIAIAIIMLIICLLCLVGGIILSIGLKSFMNIIYLSIMCIFASVWILCNAEISQFYFQNMTLTMNIDYLMLMMLPYPFLFFIDHVQKKKYNLVFKIFEYIAIVESIVCITLFVTQIADLSQLFFVIAGVFGSSLIMILITIFIDLFKYKNYSYIVVAIGIFAGIVATLFQIALFIVGKYSFGGKAVAIALLIILFTSVIETFKAVKNIERDKQMAIAQGKAESSFLANMSHEIRTPINAVIGLNEMILRESKEPQTLDYARYIDNSGRMLLSIVNDILDFSKIRSGKLKIIEDEYSLSSMIKSVCDMVNNKAKEKQLDFEVNVDQSIPNNLIGDEVRVKQIVINLLNNAVKYTDTGKVSLSITGSRTENDNIMLQFAVKDTGRGIKAESISHLFNAFERVDEKNNRAIEGTGLGLALVHNLITSMGGEIKVESEYGKGSVFTAIIPQKKAGEVTIGEVGKENRDLKAKKAEALFEAPTAKVLVVDDVRVNVTVVKSLLKRTKVNVITAFSGEECINKLKEDTFDVVLLDHLMPVLDGVETLEIIKKEKIAEGTPFVALTANAIAGAREQYISYGFTDYLTKPVNGADLEIMLSKYIPNEKLEVKRF